MIDAKGILIGVLSVRDRRYHPNRRLIEAALRFGHNVTLIHTRDCLSELDPAGSKIKIAAGDGYPDVLLPRIGATINDYALTIVRHFERSGIRVINGFDSILLARNKFLGLQALAHNGIAVPHSYLVINFKGFERAVAALGGYPVVTKMPSGRQGTGVALVDSSAMAAFIMHNVQDIANGLLVQEYIPQRGRRDIRAFVVGDRVIGAMELMPKAEDFRSNIHLTGEGTPAILDKSLSALAIGSAKALGLEVAGTDIIVDESGRARVIEVNYTPGFRGLERATGLDIASNIIAYVADKVRGNSCR